MTILTLISGGCWTIVYLDLINRGFKDKTYGMPFFALTFNVCWEFIFTFLIVTEGVPFIQQVINGVWFAFDVVIVYTYFRYGRKDFPKTVGQQGFIPWSILAFIISFVTLYFAGLEFGGSWGAAYSAFTQNLMMSILFIGMLVRRNSVDGQSMYIALFKWIGTVAPTIQVYMITGSNLVLALGVAIFMFDVIYIVMLYKKFLQLRLNPLTRRA
jgi:hypothetical protein